MGRKKRNSSLVQELINGRWTMDQEEFENKSDSNTAYQVREEHNSLKDVAAFYLKA